MTKVEIQAVAICALLSLAVVIGSTGWGYADYRPLRNYDIFALTISWVGFVFHVWRGRKSG
jgi:uncharacterized membrane protein YdcZ (DUF606 family)